MIRGIHNTLSISQNSGARSPRVFTVTVAFYIMSFLCRRIYVSAMFYGHSSDNEFSLHKYYIEILLGQCLIKTADCAKAGLCVPP